MALKMWKICTGHCGPTSLYTKIIKAYTKEEAVKKYLTEKNPDTPIRQETVDELVEHCYEHIPEKREPKPHLKVVKA